jgi:hypothetical protein
MLIVVFFLSCGVGLIVRVWVTIFRAGFDLERVESALVSVGVSSNVLIGRIAIL